MHHEAAPLVVAPSNGGLWAFVGVQVALVVLDVIMLRIGVSPVGVSLVVGGVLNLACLIFDVWSLRMVGHSVPVYLYVLGFLIVPLYIIFRIRLTKQSWWPLAAWVVVFVVGIAATPFLGGVELDSDAVETSIEEVYRDEGTTVTVDCPATLAVPVGDTFACGVDGLDSDVDQLTITVDNWLGDISWLESDLGKGA